MSNLIKLYDFRVHFIMIIEARGTRLCIRVYGSGALVSNPIGQILCSFWPEQIWCLPLTQNAPSQASNYSCGISQLFFCKFGALRLKFFIK